MNPRYREVRKGKKMTLSQAAAHLSKSKQWLSEVERGNIGLNYEDAIKLAQVYGGTPDIFLPNKSIKNGQNNIESSQSYGTTNPDPPAA